MEQSFQEQEQEQEQELVRVASATAINQQHDDDDDAVDHVAAEFFHLYHRQDRLQQRHQNHARHAADVACRGPPRIEVPPSTTAATATMASNTPQGREIPGRSNAA